MADATGKKRKSQECEADMFDTTDQDFETGFAFLLTDIARMFRNALDKEIVVSGIGLTPGQIRTLAHIDRNGGIRQTALADIMGVEPMTVSAFIDRLEAQGLVVRETDPSDRRAKLVSVTEKAEAVFEQVRPVVSQVFEHMMQDIDVDGRTALALCLGHMRERLSSTPAPVIPLSRAAA
ncbi:MarR family winged helix-turn-helix transcriptional regulator [Consotaella aegiceratis]|uniref:MarR family winged helix-turn-helix transcriptional regulator n=1 Tax=Consotaella aegiceratis TaxID=3097961 RepID=UPI002F3E4FE5